MTFSKSTGLCNRQHQAVLEACCPLERSLGRPCGPDAAPPWGAPCTSSCLLPALPCYLPIFPSLSVFPSVSPPPSLSPSLFPYPLDSPFLDISHPQQKPVFVFPAGLEISVCFTLNRVDCLGKNFTKWRGTSKTKGRSPRRSGHRCLVGACIFCRSRGFRI